MKSHRLHNVVYATFAEVAAAEKVTRAGLRTLSRDLLEYVPETDDIAIVNRLLGVLTPMNRATAILYFAHFLPWEQEKDVDGNFLRFGKRMKGEKKLKRKADDIAAWLAEEGNDIWSWAEVNVEVKQKDFKATVARAIESALKGQKAKGATEDDDYITPPLTQEELVSAIFDGGADVLALLTACEVKKAEMEEAEAQMADALDEDMTEVADAA